jgi:hypothetical protein
MKPAWKSPVLKYILLSHIMFLTSRAAHLLPILQQQCSAMAPSVLGIGVPATSDMVPWVARGFLQKSLNVMEANMQASPYDWEMLYLTPDMSFDLCTAKLHEKKWDVVMVGSKCFYSFATQEMVAKDTFVNSGDDSGHTED